MQFGKAENAGVEFSAGDYRNGK